MPEVTARCSYCKEPKEDGFEFSVVAGTKEAWPLCFRCSGTLCKLVDLWIESYPVPLAPDESKVVSMEARLKLGSKLSG